MEKFQTKPTGQPENSFEIKDKKGYFQELREDLQEIFLSGPLLTLEDLRLPK